MQRVVIVAGCESYRTGDFLAAASLLRLDAIVATDANAGFEGATGHVEVDLGDPVAAASAIASTVPDADAVVAVDDGGVEVAAAAAAQLGLGHNRPEAVALTRDKLAMRRALGVADVAQPRFAPAAPGQVAEIAGSIGFPVVVKPVGLSASRGVIRVDGSRAAGRAESRIRSILAAAGRNPDETLLVEEYVPGEEIAIEGLLVDGDLEVLAVIDKPDPLEGPFFEETMFVTPSRHPGHIQEAAIALVQEATTSLDLQIGPVHAEVRIPSDGPVKLIELAARSIGGLCGRSLTFGLLGESLESMILRNALGGPGGRGHAQPRAGGALMLPIPASGVLTGVENVQGARDIAGIDEVTITVVNGRRVEALPEGDRYLGFVIASGSTPEEVELALRKAGSTLVATIDGEIVASR